MRIKLPKIYGIVLLSVLISGCIQSGDVIEEKDHPAFERGKSLLKVGKNQEALDEFLAVTRRLTECPQSHLECGRLLLSVDARKDPIAAIYHFRRYLLLEPNSRESSKVEQLIVTAEREILRKLPGEPYGDYLDSLKLKEENDRLKRELADLRPGSAFQQNKRYYPRLRRRRQINQLLYWQLLGILPLYSRLVRQVLLKCRLMWFKVVTVFMRSVGSFMETLPV